MERKIVHIDEEKCTGCGACASACHENAIEMVDGKAKLMRDDYCDGMGDCLPECPAGAISFEVREAAAYDEAAVKENQKRLAVQNRMKKMHTGGGCPGSQMRQLKRNAASTQGIQTAPAAGLNSFATKTANVTLSAPDSDAKLSGMLNTSAAGNASAFAPMPFAASFGKPESQLQNWPVQIKLAPVTAPYFNQAKLLIAADCTAYAYASFHEDFMRGKVTLIGCPKLDSVDYSDKLTQIIAKNDIKSVTIVRMEVPCCGGLENAAKKALQKSGKFIPWQVVTISIEGNILD